MKPNTIWAAYFSATNTTKQVVTQIARRLASPDRMSSGNL